MRKGILSVLGVVLIVLAFFGAKAIIANKQKIKPKPAKVIKTVFVDTVRNSAVPIRIAANGNVTAKRRLELYAEVQGVFQGGTHLFKPGTPYQKGQTLIHIDATEHYATVQAAKSTLYNQITAAMPDLRLDYPTAYIAWQQYLRDFDMEQPTPVLPVAGSEKEKYFITGRSIYTSYYNVKNLEQRLAKYRIAAPFKGVLTEALITEGTLIRSGQKLGTYIDTSIYEVAVAIEQTYVDLVDIGAKVTLSMLGAASEYVGTVTRINKRIDPETQTIKLYVETAAPQLQEGMYLTAMIQTRDVTEAIEMNRNLLQNDHTVFIVRNGVLDLIPVTPVYFSAKKVVVKGIPDHTLVVQKNIPGAYAGMPVTVFDPEQSSKVKDVHTKS